MSGNKLFKAIVIDDDINRNSTYMEVMSEKFEVEIVNDITTLTKRKIMQYDLMVIDICLSKYVESLTAFKIIDDYKCTLPTVLVSSEWIDANGHPNEFILQVPSYKNIIKVIGWNDFNKENNNKRISGEIYYEFCKYKNFLQENPTDKVIILQISDIQFGGNISGLACNDNDRIADYLLEKNIIPDLLVITGDIADKGKKKEFDKAKEWIETFIKKLWSVQEGLTQRERDRIILVPGNHDYDLSINASELYEFKFGKAKIDCFEKKKNEVVEYENQKLGFFNFIEFAKDLTGDRYWDEYLKKPLHVISKYINLGIQFFTLNSVYTISNRNCENKFENFYCDLSSVDESQLKCEKRVNDSICNFLIMHNPPDSFKRDTQKGIDTWSRMQTLIEGNKIQVCLYGHTHDFCEAHKLNDNGGMYCKKLLCIAAPSVRLNAASRTEDANRGFNLIECNKENGVITKIIPRYFELKKATIKEIDEIEMESFKIR